MAVVTSASEEVVYLDHNSTTPLLPAVLDAMKPYWSEAFGNPASAHRVGQRARRAMQLARECIAANLDADPDEIVFTSGATEANNLAILGLADQSHGRLVCSPIEHPSVIEPVEQLQKRGLLIEWLPVDATGIVPLEAVTAHSALPISLATVMLANNETGALQPIADLVAGLRELNQSVHQLPFFHCDAAQAVGRIPISFRNLGVTTLSLSAHKFNGPRGIGALLVRKDAHLHPLFWGGHQQHGRRPGTESVVLAVGLAKALELAVHELAERTTKLARLRSCFLNYLRNQAQPVVLNGPEEGGLANTLNISFPGCEAAILLMKLDLAGVACSTGSACSSGSLLPSPVLKAMGCSGEILTSALRFSLSYLHTEKQIETAAMRIVTAVQQLRQSS